MVMDKCLALCLVWISQHFFLETKNEMLWMFRVTINQNGRQLASLSCTRKLGFGNTTFLWNPKNTREGRRKSHSRLSAQCLCSCWKEMMGSEVAARGVRSKGEGEATTQNAVNGAVFRIRCLLVSFHFPVTCLNFQSTSMAKRLRGF